MKKIILTIFSFIVCVIAFAQSDSSRDFNWPKLGFGEDTSTMIKLYPNPARDNVFVSLREWDINARYTLMLKDNKGRPVKNIVLLQRQQLIPIKASYGKGMLWIEVWKEKELLGRERLVLR
ncbi:MAG: hypothetical protein K2X48_17545 [Chitinophagaceae bacterium]|nr:hypothetical protein [Chitinophagaceae bacterium]